MSTPSHALGCDDVARAADALRDALVQVRQLLAVTEPGGAAHDAAFTVARDLEWALVPVNRSVHRLLELDRPRGESSPSGQEALAVSGA